MRSVIIASIFSFCLVWSAYGVSVELPVTTTNLDQYSYIFSVSTNAATNGVAFHVTITAKREDIDANSAAGLSIVTHTKTDSGFMSSITNLGPAIQVALKKGNRAWEADFTVSQDLLKKPGLCFVFTEYAHAIVDGKRVDMPSADFYEIKLRDFLKQ